MCPLTHTSLLALGSAVVASFVFGFIWYGPLFGKTWAKLMGFNIEDCKDKKPPVSCLLLTILGTFFTTSVMAYLINISKPSCNFAEALYIWLGFYVPLLMGSVIWEQKPWKLFLLNAAYYLLNLQLIAAILTYVR